MVCTQINSLHLVPVFSRMHRESNFGPTTLACLRLSVSNRLSWLLPLLLDNLYLISVKIDVLPQNLQLSHVQQCIRIVILQNHEIQLEQALSNVMSTLSCSNCCSLLMSVRMPKWCLIMEIFYQTYWFNRWCFVVWPWNLVGVWIRKLSLWWNGESTAKCIFKMLSVPWAGSAGMVNGSIDHWTFTLHVIGMGMLWKFDGQYIFCTNVSRCKQLEQQIDWLSFSEELFPRAKTDSQQ